MKNKFIALALVTLSIATTTVSCTKDDMNPTDVKAQNVETTKVDFSVKAESTNSATGKMIDKSVVPVYVNSVQVWAHSSLGGIYDVKDMFTFGTSTAANPLDMGFSLNGVALGSNYFTATSWASESNAKLSLGNVILANSGDDVLTTMKAHTPFIETVSDQVTAIIKKTDNAKVTLNMRTDNGRVLAKFVQETPDATKYIATVSAVAPNGEYGIDEPIMVTLPETVITPTTGFEWSNKGAYFTQKVVFTLKVYAKLANGERGALLNTITKEVAIARATTKLATFTIHNTDVETNIGTDGISLVFPTIGEEVIND